ncbi:uncharacterized protein PADG_01861 [Paracoccidioides brasiliensis Pb18]|uniref:Secreted protein n=1 Tax=Paracoccidioides brasiliensis (strain Pb18) TaxID=502780 RepID=C1G4J5_PARBD|nr:uncharacterized protein PADG_01861 [Paracoccidioides brasiliensis Pb18]EEH45711.1 hypothetical protein PADG_01861 [Paracoccidioides brasiliensis Pb18]ODH50876.1 hypothetical protein GX48_03018 [Paracoccidioides brasiliensis]
MHAAKVFAFLLSHLVLTNAQGCGDAPACIGTETCATITRTTPTLTTITTCAPTPTCLYVYLKRVVHPEVAPTYAARRTAPLPSVDQRIPSGQIAKRT